jgi:phospholipid/cholesterol/gamma-HCH transport system substrate-binding protein
MDDRIMQFRVGVVVLAVGLIAGFLILLFGHFPSLARKSYVVYIHFAQAPGVETETPVRKSGVLIGRVTKVELNNDKGDVLVTTEIYFDYAIFHDDVARIHNSLLGDAELQIVGSQNSSLPHTKVQPGETIEGYFSPDPMQALANMQGDMSAAAQSVATAGTEVAKLSHNLNDLIGNNRDQFNRLLNKTETALDSMNTSMTDLNQIIGDDQVRKNLRDSLNELPKMLHEAQDSFAMLQNTAKLADDNLHNLEGVTRPLGDRGEQIVRSFDSAIRRLDELLGQMVQFSRSLNSTQGSLGQLLNNKELYQELLDAAQSANDLMHDAKPIVDNAKILTDKLARHPELLGVRGAVSPSSGIK